MSENSHVVAKPFNTTSRRFAVGAEVSADDIPAGNPMSFADLKARRFIVGNDTKAAERAQERAEEAAPSPETVPAIVAVEPPAKPAAEDAARARTSR